MTPATARGFSISSEWPTPWQDTRLERTVALKFLAMTLVDGRTVQDLIDERPLKLPELPLEPAAGFPRTFRRNPNCAKMEV